MSTAIIVVLVAFVILLLIVVVSSVRIVRPFQQGIIEQLGKYKETKSSGLHIIIPFIQSMQLVDMREQVVDVPPQEVITSDNVVVSVDAVIYYEPTDPQRLVYNIANFFMAITKLAQTNLRNVIGDMTLDQALTSRDKLNMELRQILDDATDKWGVRVARVEIQRIDPPPDVMSAMHEQMKAERTRRAQVTTADGFREASIMKAEGEKQAAILTAEGVKQQQVLEAEGQAQAVQTLADAERYRSETVAAGEANATRSVFQAIHDGDPSNDLIAIKYLEALQGIADGRATKIYLPMDAGGLTGALAGVAELFNGAGEDPEDHGDAGGWRPRRGTVGSGSASGIGAGAGLEPPPPPPVPEGVAEAAAEMQRAAESAAEALMERTPGEHL